MEIPIPEAEGRLSELVRRAKAGDDVVLTKHGQPEARIVGMKRIPRERSERRAIIEKIVRQARARILPGVDAARSQDFLYDEETGLPK